MDVVAGMMRDEVGQDLKRPWLAMRTLLSQSHWSLTSLCVYVLMLFESPLALANLALDVPRKIRKEREAAKEDAEAYDATE